MEAGRFVDDGVQVVECGDLFRRGLGVVQSIPECRGRLGLSLRHNVGTLQQPVHGPRQQGSRSLVPGHQNGDQFVVDFLVAHGLIMLIAGGEEHRHDVGTALRTFLPATGNFIVQQAVDLLNEAAESSPGRERSQIDLQAGNQQGRATARQAKKLDQKPPQA